MILWIRDLLSLGYLISPGIYSKQIPELSFKLDSFQGSHHSVYHSASKIKWLQMSIFTLG